MRGVEVTEHRIGEGRQRVDEKGRPARPLRIGCDGPRQAVQAIRRLPGQIIGTGAPVPFAEGVRIEQNEQSIVVLVRSVKFGNQRRERRLRVFDPQPARGECRAKRLPEGRRRREARDAHVDLGECATQCFERRPKPTQNTRIL